MKRGPDHATVPKERKSRCTTHPLAAAIVAAARERGLTLSETSQFASVTGGG